VLVLLHCRDGARPFVYIFHAFSSSVLALVLAFEEEGGFKDITFCSSQYDTSGYKFRSGVRAFSRHKRRDMLGKLSLLFD